LEECVRCITSAVAAVVLAFAAGQAFALDCSSGEITKKFGGTSWVIYGCSSGFEMVLLDANVDLGSAAEIFVTICASERRFEVWSSGGKNEKARKKAEEAVREMSFDAMQALMREVSD
jgi:hypothetical protein